MINRKNIVSFSFLLLVCLLLIPSIYLVTSDHLYEEGIECSEFWQSVLPGNTVSFNLKVSNPGLSDDSFNLYIDDPPLPEDWMISFFVKNIKVRGIDIDAKRLVQIVLQVNIPVDADPGDYEFTVYANGTYTLAKRTLIITVEPMPSELEVLVPVDWLVTYPDDMVIFSLNIKNLLLYYDSFFLYFDDPGLPENWSANFYLGDKRIKTFAANPGQTIIISLEIYVSENAEAGDYNFRVIVEGEYGFASIPVIITVEERPEITRSLELFVPLEAQSILTGQSTYYPVKIENDGEIGETVFLSLDRSSDTMTWDTRFSEVQINLPPHSSRWITLDITPPEIVEEGEYTMLVTASTEDGALTDSAWITTKVLANYLLEITEIQPINPQVPSGERIDITATIRNLGESPITNLRLEVNSEEIYNILVTPVDVLALEPKGTLTFLIRVSPESNVSPGDYIIEVKAIGSETESSVRSFAVSIVSPWPWFWITTSITIIATAVVILVIQRLASRWNVKLRVRSQR